jgi:hypothetical protein
MARLGETTVQVDPLDLEELVRVAIWSFEQQTAEARIWIVRDCWDFGGLTRQLPKPTRIRGGQIGEVVSRFVAKLCACFLS